MSEALAVFDADRFLAFEQDAVGQRTDLDREIGAVHDRFQIGDRRAAPSPRTARGLEVAGALLRGAIEVVIARNPDPESFRDGTRND